jgi:hypothetical protein
MKLYLFHLQVHYKSWTTFYTRVCVTLEGITRSKSKTFNINQFVQWTFGMMGGGMLWQLQTIPVSQFLSQQMLLSFSNHDQTYNTQKGRTIIGTLSIKFLLAPTTKRAIHINYCSRIPRQNFTVLLLFPSCPHTACEVLHTNPNLATYAASVNNQAHSSLHQFALIASISDL